MNTRKEESSSLDLHEPEKKSSLDSDDISHKEDNGMKEKNFGKSLYTSERFEEKVLFPLHNKTSKKVVQWRMKERMKTGSVALTLCLNIGVDPPDVIKTNPCARLECWIDPLSLPPQKAIESIGKALQAQYERWQPRARIKQFMDPTVEDVKKLCTSLRRNAKDERVLFHFNGHGVPKPTANGEIWVFNKNYTQYIPLSLYELQNWVGTPAIYVFDCSAAGLIIRCFNRFVEQKDQESEKSRKERTSAGNANSTGSSSGNSVNSSDRISSNNSNPNSNVPSSNTTHNPQATVPNPQRDYILLGACGANEVLPSSPELPADLFTSCLTTPIQTALKWFCTQSIISGVDQDQVDKIPGHLTDRRTPYGELNWIFTAITDTIAWNALPAELFQRLFRQDLLVASLFRNFLLAERIMRCCKATPVSHPKLPPTYNHPMWQAWDLAADHCLAQLPQLISDPTYEYRHSTFFTEQLTAFEVWLEFGTEDKNPPEQLPIVLQVLLSPQHRSRALDLLARFLDLGPWAVNQALSVGIFPYVLKLLQSPAAELRKTLVFIWAKILALDQSCQTDLVKDNGQQYFINVLSNHEHSVQELQLSAFVLSIICNNHKAGQVACLNAKLLQICLGHLSSLDADVRRYVVLAMAKLWENHEEGKKQAIKEKIHEKLCSLLSDPVAEVRAAAVYALGTFIGRSGVSSADREQRDMIEYRLGLTFAVVTADSSPLVRKELVISLSALVNAYEEKFRIIAKTSLKQEQLAEAKRKKKMKSEDSGDLQPEIEENHIYEFLWKLILSLANDPFPVVAQMAILVIKKIKDQAYDELQKVPSSIIPNNSIPKPPNEESSKSIKPPKIKKPLSSFFAGGPKSQNPQSPGPTLSTGRAPIPQVTWNEKIQQAMEGAEIKSSFYDWSCQRYSQSTLRIDDEDETAHAFNERKWRIQRNLEMIKEAEKIKDDTQFAVSSLDNEIAILENDNQVVSQLRFHPFENIVVVADERDSIAVWNWESGQPILHFNNQNPPGSRITSLHLLNENDNLLIAVGSDDAVVRVWGGVYKPENLHLVTAWRALGPDAEQNNLVLEWQQKNELMIASGSIDILKVWDVNRELFLQDIPTTINQPVTCMVSDKWDNRNLIIAGFWDGSVRTYDRRIGGKYSMVNQLTDPTNSATVKRSVVNVFLPIRGQIVCGTTTGEIKFWDVRQAKSSVRTLTADKKGEQVLTALAVHDYAPIIAMGQEQRIKVMNLTTEASVFIRYHDGFLGQRIGPISSLCFHPYRVMLGAGATDSIVSIYASDTYAKVKD